MVERAGERIKKNGITFTNHQAASCVCLPAGDRDRPIFEEVLLVDQDEEDVIAAGGRVRGDDGTGLRRRPRPCDDVR